LQLKENKQKYINNRHLSISEENIYWINQLGVNKRFHAWLHSEQLAPSSEVPIRPPLPFFLPQHLYSAYSIYDHKDSNSKLRSLSKVVHLEESTRLMIGIDVN
jgi:hypothetical protein